MRPTFTMTAMFVVSLTISSASAQGPKSRRVALIIGTQSYDGAGLGNLYYPDNDCARIAAVLQGKGKHAESVVPYDEVLVMTRSNSEENPALLPTAQNIRKQLEAIPKMRLTKNDVLLVYVNGHGFAIHDRQTDTIQTVYCPSGARLRDPKTLVSMSSIYDAVSRSQAGLKVVLVDTCRNVLAIAKRPGEKGVATAVRPSVEPPKADGKTYIPLASDSSIPPGTVVLFACSPKEQSFEDPARNASVFAYHIANGLAGAAARLKEDKVTFGLLEDYVRTQCQGERRYRQTPHASTNVAVSIPLIALDAGASFLKADFAQIDSGTLPKKWTGDLSVRNTPRGRALGLSKQGTAKAHSPKLRLSGDFTIRFTLNLYVRGDNIALRLNGRGDLPDCVLSFKRFGEGLRSSSKAAVQLEGKTGLTFRAWSVGGDAPVVELRRRGNVFSVFVDGKQHLSEQLDKFAGVKFDRLTLELSSTATAKLHEYLNVQVRQYNGAADFTDVCVRSLEVKTDTSEK